MNKKTIIVDAKAAELALKAKPEQYGVAMKVVKRLESQFGVQTYIGRTSKVGEK